MGTKKKRGGLEIDETSRHLVCSLGYYLIDVHVSPSLAPKLGTRTYAELGGQWAATILAYLMIAS